MTIMTSSTPTPSVESFALSSALLRDLVSSWVPPTFGITKPAAEREKGFAAAMSRGGRRGAEWETERLGLGHPLLEPGAAVAGPSSARRDFSTIAIHLGKPGAEGSKAKRPREGKDESDEEEETSRFRSVGKGKGKAEVAGVQALLNGNKKKKKKLKRESVAGDEKRGAVEAGIEAGEGGEDQEEEPSIAPLAILKPTGVAAPSASPDPEPELETSTQSASNSGMTKAERRRLAKKRRKEEKKRSGPGA